MRNMMIALPLMIGTTEIVLLAGVALLIFGGKKLPEMMRNMGKGVKEFKEGVKGAPQDFQNGMNGEKEQTPHSEQNGDSIREETKVDSESNE